MWILVSGKSADVPRPDLPDVSSTWTLRAAADLGLAAWFGGALMGAVSLNGASIEVDDPAQRSRVANAGWFRWAAVLPFALGAHLTGAVGLTRRHGPADRPSERIGVAIRTSALVTAMTATAASGWAGRRVSAAGDVPVATAVTPIADTPPEVARAQRVLRTLQWLIPITTGVCLVVDAWQQHHGGTRLVPHRWLPTKV